MTYHKSRNTDLARSYPQGRHRYADIPPSHAILLNNDEGVDEGVLQTDQASHPVDFSAFLVSFFSLLRFSWRCAG